MPRMKSTTLYTIVVVAQLLLTLVTSENILFYFGITGYSHVNSIWPLVDKLVGKGHNVTVLTPFVPKHATTNGNLTIIEATDVLAIYSDFWDANADLIKERQSNTHHNVLDPLIKVGYEACSVILQSPQTKNVVYNSQFDLVILDEEANQCAMAMAHYKYKAAFIIYSAFTFCTFMYDEYGIPIDLSIPDNEYGVEMTFWERLNTEYRILWYTYGFHKHTFLPMGGLVKDAFGLDFVPSISDLYLHTSLVFINIHPSIDYARSLPPLFIPVAGMQIPSKRNSLPKDLQKFISNPGSEGFIYISFGSVVQISKSNHEIREKFFNALGNLTSIQFVWKWEGEIPNNAPLNIYFSNWLPQQDLLAHEKIRGAILHGGINGAQEAVFYHVPTLFFPIVYDQDYNALSIANKGAAIVMEISSFEQEELQYNIREVLTNATIKENMIKLSQLFKDRQTKPADTALWWTEYVLRHKDVSKYLVPPGKRLTWYQRRHLDIWLLVFSVLLFMLVLLTMFAYRILVLIFGYLNLTKSESGQALSNGNGGRLESSKNSPKINVKKHN